ncbi:MAG: hypothetical protein KGI90_17620 [Burkholderiales bacterium]|nr:hypothetical protein [Burkholderiales bacterium]
MHNITEHNITQAAAERYADGGNARLKQVLGALLMRPFRGGDPCLDRDAAFGVRSSLIVRLERHDAGPAPDGSAMAGPFHTLRHRLALAPAGEGPQ